MNEHPISFSGAMVRALLDGRKRVTRRVIRTAPPVDRISDAPNAKADGQWWSEPAGWIRCPFGAAGDTLWVREALQRTDPMDGIRAPSIARYEADDEVVLNRGAAIAWRWKHASLPARFMPRRAARIFLRVVSVRAERLHEITWSDIRAEGVDCPEHDGPGLICLRECPALREAFRAPWDSLNGARAPWASDPWVWVVEFAREAP